MSLVDSDQTRITPTDLVSELRQKQAISKMVEGFRRDLQGPFWRRAFTRQGRVLLESVCDVEHGDFDLIFMAQHYVRFNLERAEGLLKAVLDGYERSTEPLRSSVEDNFVADSPYESHYQEWASKCGVHFSRRELVCKSKTPSGIVDSRREIIWRVTPPREATADLNFKHV